MTRGDFLRGALGLALVIPFVGGKALKGLDADTPSAASVPEGWLGLFRPGDVPEGWLVADGRLVSRRAYPRLFQTIGYSYGGRGGRFALPDMRARLAVRVQPREGPPVYDHKLPPFLTYVGAIKP